MDDRITVSVDADVADAYRAVSDGDRRKLDLLVSLRLREATHPNERCATSCGTSATARSGAG